MSQHDAVRAVRQPPPPSAAGQRRAPFERAQKAVKGFDSAFFPGFPYLGEKEVVICGLFSITNAFCFGISSR